MHNSFRSSLALGEELMVNGLRASPAKNMYQMKYDCNLEQLAQSWANLCQFRHSPENLRNAGENLYALFFYMEELPMTALCSAMRMWWGELYSNGISTNDTSLTWNAFNTGIGHFSQVNEVFSTTHNLMFRWRGVEPHELDAGINGAQNTT
uniref:SCP domain-containing protein n=1 Tax=Acrobeloides nanus TaxID=290746 RepID=A0A914BX83_9BILA